MNTQLRFGVSTWLWESPFTTASASLFPKIKEMGFDAVEIPVEDPDLIDAAVISAALKENGLEALVCGVFGPSKDLTHENTAVHDTCFRYLERCFEMGNIWGAGFVGGPMYSAVGKARMLPDEERKCEWELAVTNLTKVCNLARAHGQLIAIEPLNRFESDLVNTAADVMRMIKDINHDCARVLLDGFHMTIEEASIRKAIEITGDKLLHVQVSENHRGIPGTGLTPWDELREGLKEVGYKGVVSIESFTPEIKELAAAVCIWKNLAGNQDDFAREGIGFLRTLFNN